MVSISDKKYSGHIHYISRTADELTRNFKVQIKLKNPENKIISGLSSEVEIGTTSEDAFFISSSLISLDNKGILGVKVIIEKKVHFLPVEILSDMGNGYWIKIKKESYRNQVLIITQGNEYVMDGEEINFKLEENVQ